MAYNNRKVAMRYSLISFPVRLLVILILVHFGWASDRKTYPMDIPAAAVRSINFDVQEGEFVLRGDPTATSVNMRLSIDRLWIFRLGEEGILKHLIKVSGEGTSQLNIVTDIPRSLANWGRAEYPIDIEVVVPASIPLHVHDTSGIIRISQVNALVDVHDGSGTLTISGVHGAVTVVKDSGDIQVERVDDVTTITSKTGQMKLRDLARVQIEESDGNLEVVNTGPTRIHNKGGNLRVSNVKGALEIEDESGEIQVSDVNGDVKIRDTSGQIRVSRAGIVLIDDTDGDVTVRDATSVSVRQKESGQVKVSAISGSVVVPPKIQLHHE
jgi:DUF4097 and DUF4098 domain-containing protein YvlB